jgi:hypothetical protein
MLGCKECSFAIDLDNLNLNDYILMLEGLCTGCLRVYALLEEMEW